MWALSRLSLPSTCLLLLAMVTCKHLLFLGGYAGPWLLPAASSYPEGRDW